MERFIKQQQEQKISKLMEHYSKKALDLMINTGALTDREWKEFKISDLFDIFTGTLIDKKLFSEGNIPRITATDINNGIAFFTDEIKDKRFKTYENFISISFLGSVFYQKNTVSLDMKIHGIKPKEYTLNSYIAKFLIPIIKNFTFKYSYGYQLSTSVLRTQKILLPVTQEGTPDWQFMEDFIKRIEQKKIEVILSYYKQLKTNILMGGVE